MASRAPEIRTNPDRRGDQGDVRAEAEGLVRNRHTSQPTAKSPCERASSSRVSGSGAGVNGVKPAPGGD